MTPGDIGVPAGFLRPTRRAVLAGAVSSLAAPALARAAGEDAWAAADRIVAGIRAPVFPDRDFIVTDFGARPGSALATDAFVKAIAACAAAGGGRVVVPAGDFLTGPIRLKSNVNLHLAQDATIRFSTDPRHYPLVHTRWEGSELMNYSPLIYAYRERNIAITGRGTIDGQADDSHWWAWKGPWQGTVDNGARAGAPNQLAARKRLVEMNERGVPVEKRVFGEGAYLRPQLIQPYGCDTVLIEGVRLRRSPFWQVNPVLCRNVTVRGLDILGHGPNTDGCDPESCDGVLIEHNVFDTGDDCIAIKSGRNADGRRSHAPSQNIVIRDCRMKQGHAGIAIGSEISGGVRNIFAERCRMDSPDLHFALRFKNNAVRGGLLEQLHYRDLDVGQVAESAIFCDFNYEEGANGPYKPILRDVSIERMRVARCARVLDAQGLPGAPIERLTIRDSSFSGVQQRSIVEHVEGLTISDVTVDGKPVTRL